MGQRREARDGRREARGERTRITDRSCTCRPERGERRCWRRWSGNEPHAGYCGSQRPGSGSGSGGHLVLCSLRAKAYLVLQTYLASSSLSPREPPPGEGCWRLSRSFRRQRGEGSRGESRPCLSRRRAPASASKRTRALEELHCRQSLHHPQSPEPIYIEPRRQSQVSPENRCAFRSLGGPSRAHPPARSGRQGYVVT
jgi:hypothetical protein